MQSAELIVIGGGLIGLASAWHFLQTNPDSKALVLEKESDIAQHQSEYNQGVVHSGVLAPVGSLKRALSISGNALLRDFCAQEKLTFEMGGKLIVALDSAEIAQLEIRHHNAAADGIETHLLDGDAMRAIEPAISGDAALHVPSSASVNYGDIARRLALRIEMMGGRVLTNTRVIGIQETAQGVIVQAESRTFAGQCVINAAGLYADRLATASGIEIDWKIIPFRGESYRLSGYAARLVNSQIFPVPDDALPFTGIHLTRQTDGTVIAGPNSLLAGARDGYQRGRINLRDSLDHLTSRRVRRLTLNNFSTALWEQRRSWNPELFAITLQRMVPGISEHDLEPITAGVSGWPVDADGAIYDDFLFEQHGRVLHVLSAPTPGATACLSIGQKLVNQLLGNKTDTVD